MAPPSPRRPGFSRRAQYSLFAGYVAAVGGVAVGLLLIVTARFDPQGHAALQGFFADIFSPVSGAARNVGATISDGLGSVSAYFDAASKNKAMAREVAASRQAVIAGKAAALENARLKQMMRFIDRLPGQVAVARLVSSTGASSRRYAILAAGRRDGIASGQPVLTADGLVGRVVQAGERSSRVLLIIDGGNIVPVRRVPDGAPAFAEGMGDGRINIRPLEGGGNSFRRGDVFVTSGTGGIYRPGIPVVIAVRFNRDTTIGRPLADPTRFDFAAVEREFVEPPPAPAATP